MSKPEVLTRRQVREVDRLAIQEHGFSSLVLMENAGRGCADVLTELQTSGPVVIVCGKGNNAGDGFVIARHLLVRKIEPRVILTCQSQALRGDAQENYRLLERCDPTVIHRPESFSADALDRISTGAEWILDALLGTGATGPPRAPLDAVVRWINGRDEQVMAIDVPSGLDCDSGAAARDTIRADTTCTFVAAKPGLLVKSASCYVGQLRVLDIGVPWLW